MGRAPRAAERRGRPCATAAPGGQGRGLLDAAGRRCRSLWLAVGRAHPRQEYLHVVCLGDVDRRRSTRRFAATIARPLMSSVRIHVSRPWRRRIADPRGSCGATRGSRPTWVARHADGIYVSQERGRTAYGSVYVIEIRIPPHFMVDCGCILALRRYTRCDFKGLLTMTTLSFATCRVSDDVQRLHYDLVKARRAHQQSEHTLSVLMLKMYEERAFTELGYSSVHQYA